MEQIYIKNNVAFVGYSFEKADWLINFVTSSMFHWPIDHGPVTLKTM